MADAPKLNKRQAAEALREELKYRLSSEMLLAVLDAAAECESAEADLASLVRQTETAQRTLLDVRARIAREDEEGRAKMAEIHARVQQAERDAELEITKAGKDASLRVAAEREKARREVDAVRAEAEGEMSRYRAAEIEAKEKVDALNAQLESTRAQLAPLMGRA